MQLERWSWNSIFWVWITIRIWHLDFIFGIIYFFLLLLKFFSFQSSTLIGKFWKTHPIFSRNFSSPLMSQTDCWATHLSFIISLNEFFRNRSVSSGVTHAHKLYNQRLDEFSKNWPWSPVFQQNWVKTLEIVMEEFSIDQSYSDPRNFPIRVCWDLIISSPWLRDNI